MKVAECNWDPVGVATKTRSPSLDQTRPLSCVCASFDSLILFDFCSATCLFRISFTRVSVSFPDVDDSHSTLLDILSILQRPPVNFINSKMVRFHFLEKLIKSVFLKQDIYLIGLCFFFLLSYKRKREILSDFLLFVIVRVIYLGG